MITADGVYKLVRAYSALLGFQISKPMRFRATAATNVLDHQANMRLPRFGVANPVGWWIG